MSSEQSVPRVSKLPFLIGDALLLGCALLIYQQSARPFGPWELAAVVGCVALGAWLAVKPFLMEYEAATRLAEAQNLTDTVAQIQRLDSIAAHIGNATAQWQGVQDGCTRTVASAKEITERMAGEAKSFMEFLQKANDSERAALRLEAEKLRRGEGDWLQVLIRILDHVLALHGAAVHSGQPQLAKQITQFRDVILETTRRVGLLPFGSPLGQPFDAAAHRRLDEKAETPAGAKIAETLAPGYTFQGKPVRRALVRLEGEELPPLSGAPEAASRPLQPEPQREPAAELVEAHPSASESPKQAGELF